MSTNDYTEGCYVVHDEVNGVFEVRLRRASGRYVPMGRYGTAAAAEQAAGWRNAHGARPEVQLPPSRSLKALLRRWVARG